MPPNSAAARGWGGIGAGIAAGLALALAQAPFGIWPLIFLAAPALLWAAKPRDGKGRFRLGWWAGSAYFALSLMWIVEPFLIDMPRTGWMAPFALVFMAGGLALFWGAGFAAAGPRPNALSLAAAWTLAEYARSTVLTGFPWALTAYAWLDTPVAQLSAVFGPHGLGFLTLFAAMLPASLPPIAGAAICAALAGLGWWQGTERLRSEPVTVRLEAPPITVRLVQPDADQRLKWHTEMIPVFFRRMMDATAAPGDVQAVIWPEAAVPYLIDQRQDYNAMVAAARPGATVILGGRRMEERDGREFWYNSLAALARDGSLYALYDKHHLVPFGEYLPFPELWDRFGLQALAANAGRFASGPGPEIAHVPGLPAFQPLICYEMIFPHEIATGERPEWLVHLTNDSWFGTVSGPYQHLAQTRMRAIEFGLPVARAANTGISAMIDGKGRVTAELALGEQGFVDAVLPPALAPTPYAKRGDRPVMLAVAAGLLLGLLPAGLRRRAGSR